MIHDPTQQAKGMMLCYDKLSSYLLWKLIQSDSNNHPTGEGWLLIFPKTSQFLLTFQDFVGYLKKQKNIKFLPTNQPLANLMMNV